MADAGSGTVTLVFTDIDGSTRLLEQLGNEYATLLSDHHRAVEDAARDHGGRRVDAAGDGLFLSFATAKGALLACIEAQRHLERHEWPSDARVRVRMGIHTGEPLSAASGYVGMDVHRAARISAAGHGGQILLSAAAHSLVRSVLPDGVALRDLGEHRLKDLANPEHIYQAIVPDLQSDFPPIRSLDTLPNNLPRQLSSFVGRSAEIAEVAERLSSSSIVTLTGPGGVGKTRLALEVGVQLIDAYPDGVWLVELGALNDRTLVAEAVASALRLKQHAGSDLPSTLSEALAPQRLLLILDNCEHLIDAVAELTGQLLRRCAELQILATSREALGVAGESLLPVPSMSVPEADAVGGTAAVEELARCDAVRLFVDRACAAQPGFTLTERNASAVAEICRRLDGIPLAVELSAARIRVLPPQQIASRLGDRFRLLTGGSRSALPRHRTLRAAIDWSFELLPDAERVLLARLAVFTGGFSLEAAEAVCSGGAVERNDMLDLLSRLIDKSLLMQDDSPSEARYQMLETIRDYAQERLVESGDASATFSRHRDWFVALADEARSAFLAGPEQAVWLERLARDHDNLRAALQWAHEDPGGAASELRLASALWRFWEIRGHLVEGSIWLQRALDRTADERSPTRANALTGAGVLAVHRGDYQAAAAFHEASLLLHRELGNPLSISAACNNLASVAAEQGDLARARALYQEANGLSRAAGDAQTVAFTWMNLADLAARQGDVPEAEKLYAQSIGTFEANGDLWGMANALSRLAQIMLHRGEIGAARSRYEEARTLYARIGDERGIARTLASLGDLAAVEKDFPRAGSLYRESLALRQQLGDRAGVASMLERLAGNVTQDPERAARLIGLAGALREAIGARLPPAMAAELDQFLAGLRESIGAEALRDALDDGRRMSLSAGIAYAIEQESPA